MPHAPTKRRKTRHLRSPLGGFLRGAGGAAFAIVAAPFAAALKLMPKGEWFAEVGRRATASPVTRRIAGVAGGLLLVVGLCVVMKRNLEASPAYTLDPGRIALGVELSWAKGEFAQRLRSDIETDLRDTLRDLPAASAFDDQLLPRVAAALERSPWVARVVRIDRKHPAGGGTHAQLRPVIDLRRPLLAVELADSYQLVDGDGVCLPLAPSRAAFADIAASMRGPLRVVRGVNSAPPGAGKSWQSQEIIAALSMERVLRESAMDGVLPIEAMELVGIPIEADAKGRVRYKPGGGVVLIPDTRLLPQTSLLWGRPPVHASTLEPSLDDKISAMKVELANVDALKGKTVDLSVKRG